MADTEAIRGLLQDGDKVIIPYVNPATKNNEGIVKVDDVLSSTSENPVQNKVINTALSGKQATLVSGTNIKTVNNTSLLGNGNIAVQSVINDLSDIRSNATAGKGASDTISGYGDVVTHDADEFMPADTVIPVVNNATLTIQKNGTAVDTFTANASADKVINITVPTKASDVSALPSSTKYGASLSMSINSTTYVLTAQMKDQDGNNLGTAQTVDLPIESLVMDVDFDEDTNELVIKLQSGSTTRVPIGSIIGGLQSEINADNKLDADFIEDTLTTKKLVTTAEKNTWNGKQDAISDLATIRSNASNGNSAYTTIQGYGDIVTHDADEFLTEHQDLSGYQTKITSSNKLSADLLSEGTTNKLVSATEKSTWNGKQNAITSSNKLSADLLSEGTTNKLVSASEKSTWNGKQNALVSGTNIKTINGNSLLGSGNIEIQGGTDVEAYTATEVQTLWGSI